MEPLRAVKGMHDILPSDVPRWQHVEKVFRDVASRYAFEEVRTPALEPTELFVRSVGDTTDIVEKEMYTFEDKGENSLTLRPEGTASAVRAYIEHKVYANEPVAKWIYMGAMFRRERPAKGRYRQFHQLGAEVFGDPGPFADAEIIDLVLALFGELGITGLDVRLNSLGSGETRQRYSDALRAFLEPKRASLCADCQRRLDRNPLRVLDCKVPADAEAARGAPAILEFLSAEDDAHFRGLRETLDAWGVSYQVDPRLVRGLDYYNRTLFEIKSRTADLGAQDTICGGGRYDNLVESMGGPATPAIGFGIGIERVLLSMPEVAKGPSLAAFVIAAGPGLRTEAARVTRELRQAGIGVDNDLRGQSLKSQLRRADKSGARFAIILGDDEVARRVAQVKDLALKSQTDVPMAELASHLRSRTVESRT